MMAYSSVEHMGIVATAVAFGGSLGLYGALLQLINHAVAKSLMFFASGHLLLKYGTKDIDRVSGVVRLMPVTGGMLILGALALTGSPPFAVFISEFTILSAGFKNGQALAALVLLGLIAIIFVSFLRYINRIAFGTPAGGAEAGEFSKLGLLAMGISVVLVVGLGLIIPAPLGDLLHQAAAVLGGAS